MRMEGRLSRWDDARGFGFISAKEGQLEVFVHIKAFAPGGGRPQLNERLGFEIGQDAQGRIRALNVRRLDVATAQRSRGRNPAAQWGGASLLVIPAFVLVFTALAIVWHVPKFFALSYLVASALCFLVYFSDKKAAGRRAQRTPENTLHVLSLIGGWPGALLAQQFLRHKSVKGEFRATFWLTVVLNVLGLVFLASPYGQRVLAY